MLLIHPPLVKPGEPPPGLARLSGFLAARKIDHRILEANIEGIYHLLHNAPSPVGTWSSRAVRHLSRHLGEMKKWDIYRNMDRYKRTVADINRVLEDSARGCNIRLSLADYNHDSLTPVRSADLLYAAEHPQENPFFPYFSSRFGDLIPKGKSFYVGFSLNYLSQALTTFAMIGFLRSEFPDITVIVGGGLITSWMRNPCWRDPFRGLIDHLVAGPGEEALLNIIAEKRPRAGDFHYSYDLMPLSDYLSPGFIMPIATSTGCHWGRCAFCPEKAERNRYRQTNPETVIPGLSFLIKRYRPLLIHFTDNAISPLMLKKIADRPPGAPWYGFVRVMEQLTDEGFCRALKDAGCVMLKVGIESGDQHVLDRMNKGFSVEAASRMLAAVKKAGIGTYIYLLFGTPAETIDSARKTLDFTVRHSEFIDFLNLALFNLPLANSQDLCVTPLDFYGGDLSLYTDFHHPQRWDRRQVRLFLRDEFKRDPYIRSLIMKQPPFFTSNHAPLFLLADQMTKDYGH